MCNVYKLGLTVLTLKKLNKSHAPNQPSTPQPHLGLYIQASPSPTTVPLVPTNPQQFYVNPHQVNIPSFLLRGAVLHLSFTVLPSSNNAFFWLWQYFKARFLHLCTSWRSRHRFEHGERMGFSGANIQKAGKCLFSLSCPVRTRETSLF